MSFNRALPDATIVVAQRKHGDLTVQLLRSLRAFEETCWPVVVVDDGSPDDSLEQVRGEGLRGVTVIARPHKGVSAAWNAGATRATTRYLVFLNNDVRFVGEALDHLLTPLRERRAAMTGVRFRNERMLPIALLKRLPTTRVLEGWCLATTAADFERMGGFDESLRLYWSDTDLQLRMLLVNGGAPSLEAVPGLPLEHAGHGTVRHLRHRLPLWRQDRKRFLARWSGLVGDHTVQATAMDFSTPRHQGTKARRATDGTRRGHG